jgi:Uma2 family endonuclease
MATSATLAAGAKKRRTIPPAWLSLRRWYDAMETRLMPEGTRLVTAEELERFPDDDWRYELVQGRLIRMSPVGFEHGQVVVRLLTLLDGYARAGNVGTVLTEVGFKLKSNPDTVRAPDVAFIRKERLRTDRRRGFWHGPPDLAVEVLSPDDRPGDIRSKVDEYLGCGTPLVLLVDPDARTITIHRRLAPPVTLEGADDVVDLEEGVPGFHCTVADVFGPESP